jgi:heme O synthase-like polyprenyltransferase
VLLGCWFVRLALGFVRRDRSGPTVRRLFFGSIVYLPLLLGALVLDRLLLR